MAIPKSPGQVGPPLEDRPVKGGKIKHGKDTGYYKKTVITGYDPKTGKIIRPKNILQAIRKAAGGNGGGGDDTAKKLARIADIKAAALNNKKYNVRTSTTPVGPSSASAVAPILYGGTGGGGYYGSAEMLESGGGFSLSDIPSIVWIVLAVGAGWFLIASSGGKGKGKGKGSLF